MNQPPTLTNKHVHAFLKTLLMQTNARRCVLLIEPSTFTNVELVIALNPEHATEKPGEIAPIRNLLNQCVQMLDAGNSFKIPTGPDGHN